MQEENIKTFVIDASFILSYFLPDEDQAEVYQTFDNYQKGEINFLSSVILPIEFTNGIKFALTSKRLTEERAFILLEDFQNISIEYPPLDLEKVLKLAIKENLSVYDASYIWLAKEYNINLLTLDKNLAKIAAK